MELFVVALLIWAACSRRDMISGIMGKSMKSRTPEEHLKFLVGYMREASVTPAQVNEAWATLPAEAEKAQKRDMSKIVPKLLNFLGALLVFAGLGIYIGSFWEEMSSFLRVLTTLGAGIALYAYTLVMVKEGKLDSAFFPLICLSVLLETGGWLVLQHEVFPEGNDYRKALLVCFTIMAAQQWGVFNMMKRGWLAFIAIGFTYAALDTLLDIMGVPQEYIAIMLGGSMFATSYILAGKAYTGLADLLYLFAAGWFGAGLFVTVDNFTTYGFAALVTGSSLFLLANALKEQGRYGVAMFGFLVSILTLTSGIFTVVEDFTNPGLAALAAGISLCSVGYGFREDKTYNLTGPSFLIGSALFYAGLFDEVRHTPLELLYFGVAVGMMYGSALLHSRALLFTSVLAILGFIGYYTTEHFMHSAGWPIALMIMGAAFLGVGSVAVRIKRKYDM